jgi:uncharacterized protein YecE (DUF72 family)
MADAWCRHSRLRCVHPIPGQTRLYGSSYDDAALNAWAERIRAWRDANLDVFAYFNNDEGAYAPRDALRLRELVG